MQKSITSKLGVHGLQKLDAVILSVLATNATVLLIGPHGSAKTLIAQRVAETLDCTFRHYNTSLLNYDDLVGYPIPDQENKELHFIQTPGTIWNAEFVFFDEISRARPEIQNKVFPIVHEHRVQGIKLDQLNHCWAAMNPPSDSEQEQDMIYSGSWSLDVALADRFSFVVRIPGYNEFPGKVREEILLGGNENSNRPVDLKTLIESVRKQLKSITEAYTHWTARYLTSLIPLLENADLTISGRRARFLFENILAFYSSEMVLLGKSDINDAALRSVMASLPHSAYGKIVEQGKVLLAHKQAVQDVNEGADSVLVQLRSIKDPVKRVEYALHKNLDKNLLNQILSDSFAALSIVDRYVWVHKIFPRISENGRVGAVVLELMAEVESNIYEGANSSFSEAIAHTSTRWRLWQDLNKSIARSKTDDSISAAHVAVARALFFTEKENVSMSRIQEAFAHIDERISSCN